LRSEATGFNDLAAFDEAIKNIELQIRRIHEKTKSHGRKTLRTMEVDVSE
jgi:ribosome-associated translation inhibitor RaiA